MPAERPAPLISVVLPTLNASRYLEESIQSLLNQTCGDFELIVVDGGSTDGTVALAERIADPRITIIRQAHNRDKLPGALNEGFAAARGEYYTWAQADDWYTPDAFAVMAQALRDHPDVGLVYADYDFVDEHGAFLKANPLGPPEGLYQSNVVGQCFLYRATVAKQAGPYDPAYFMSEDTHFWVRVYRCSKLMKVPGTLYFHRLHPDSLTIRDYGQYLSRYVAARARREVLRISWLEYQRQLSAVYIEEAFAAYARRDMARVRRCLAHSLVRNPTWLKNRGVWSIGFQSVFGARRRRQPNGPRYEK
jgi:glycosyltransferase involved in cell wall biosynthesis